MAIITFGSVLKIMCNGGCKYFFLLIHIYLCTDEKHKEGTPSKPLHPGQSFLPPTPCPGSPDHLNRFVMRKALEIDKAYGIFYQKETPITRDAKMWLLSQY